MVGRPMPHQDTAEAKGKTMAPAPEGAQISEDGNYWWDGAAWQLIEQEQPETETEAEAEAEESTVDLVSDWEDATVPEELEPDVLEKAREIQAAMDADPFFGDLADMDVEALVADNQ